MEVKEYLNLDLFSQFRFMSLSLFHQTTLPIAPPPAKIISHLQGKLDQSALAPHP